ncbi:unnamed protein product [Notodromas monacha]|uniref:SAM domain-containing protein n=1 Tax=Notodromas monacha TaxID=399045 RepID=A0A7R9BKU8_9CRUS|nr:unnamed protein product [Notodromas monacha]CAG0916549.1 unnamed protein product [Notodromas monacha]
MTPTHSMYRNSGECWAELLQRADVDKPLVKEYARNFVEHKIRLCDVHALTHQQFLALGVSAIGDGLAIQRVASEIIKELDDAKRNPVVAPKAPVPKTKEGPVVATYNSIRFKMESSPGSSDDSLSELRGRLLQPKNSLDFTHFLMIAFIAERSGLVKIGILTDSLLSRTKVGHVFRVKPGRENRPLLDLLPEYGELQNKSHVVQVSYTGLKAYHRSGDMDRHTAFEMLEEEFPDAADRPKICRIFGTFLLSQFLIPRPHYHPDKSLGRVHHHDDLPETVNFIFPHSAETDFGRQLGKVRFVIIGVNDLRNSRVHFFPENADDFVHFFRKLRTFSTADHIYWLSIGALQDGHEKKSSMDACRDFIKQYPFPPWLTFEDLSSDCKSSDIADEFGHWKNDYQKTIGRRIFEKIKTYLERQLAEEPKNSTGNSTVAKAKVVPLRRISDPVKSAVDVKPVRTSLQMSRLSFTTKDETASEQPPGKKPRLSQETENLFKSKVRLSSKSLKMRKSTISDNEDDDERKAKPSKPRIVFSSSIAGDSGGERKSIKDRLGKKSS